MAIANIKNINDDQYHKTLFVLKCKGSNLAEEVRKMVEQYSKEFDKMKK